MEKEKVVKLQENQVKDILKKDQQDQLQMVLLSQLLEDWPEEEELREFPHLSMMILDRY